MFKCKYILKYLSHLSYFNTLKIVYDYSVGFKIKYMKRQLFFFHF